MRGVTGQSRATQAKAFVPFFVLDAFIGALGAVPLFICVRCTPLLAPLISGPVPPLPYPSGRHPSDDGPMSRTGLSAQFSGGGFWENSMERLR